MKRAFDILFSICALVVSAPIFLVVSILIRLDSRGPVFFVQDRVGRGGKIFRVIKFRTMIHGACADPETGRVLKLGRLARDNPSITRAGRVLRMSGLDELPQLWNILKGDMSFVGPRPTLPEHAERYNDIEKRRLEVPQGITGLAQISGRTSLPWPERIKLDLRYLEERSMSQDFRILFLTLTRMLSGALKW